MSLKQWIIYTQLAPWFAVMVTIKCLNALFSRCFDNHPILLLESLQTGLLFWSHTSFLVIHSDYHHERFLPSGFGVTPKFGGFLVCWENKTTLPHKHLFVASSFNYSTQLGPTLMQIYGKFEGFPLVLRVKFGLVSFNTVETIDGRNPNQPPGM